MIRIMIALGILFLGICAYAIYHFEGRIDQCAEKDGIMVKTAEGYQCIDAKVIK